MMQKGKTLFGALSAMLILWGSTTAYGVIAPFTEDFSASSANWRQSNVLDQALWSAAGGPDGGAFASAEFNFLNSAASDTPALFRAQDEVNSSGNAFVGNWITAGVTEFRAMLRHDAGVPLVFFTRFASPVNFPAAARVNFTPVPSGVWTLVSFPIDGALVYEGGPSNFLSVFSNVGHVQVGVSVPGALAGVDQSVTFDIDKAMITPEPSALAIVAVGALALVRRRRS